MMNRFLLMIMVLATTLLLPRQAAAEFEFSFGFSFNRTNYGSPEDYSWTRRWGTSVGYHFNDRSEIEFAFQDVFDRTKIGGYEDTGFHDQIYSINWVQSFTGRKFPVQPYVKVGIGQLNRDASGTYGSGASPNPRVDSVTGVLGAGMRIYLTRTIALRTEVTSYLTGGAIGTWQDNIATSIGASLYY